MPQVVNIAEDYSIGSPITGDLVLSRLVLSGWGGMSSQVPTIETWSDRHRMWVVFTQSSGLLEFMRRNADGGTDVVCSGTVASGLVTLAAQNSSGISGSCEATNGTLGTNPTQDSTCSVIVTYAHENDLVDRYAAVATYLDSNSKWNAQGTRFEAILKSAKRELDEIMATRLASRLKPDGSGRRNLAIISDPRQIAPIHACYTLGMIEQFRKHLPEAEYWRGQAMALLKATEINLDYEQDANIDTRAGVASGYLVRG